MQNMNTFTSDAAPGSSSPSTVSPQLGPEHAGRQRLLHRGAVAGLLLITLLGGGLRLAHLDGPSLWVDELYSVRDAAQLSRGETFGWTKTISHLPVWVSLQLNGVAPGELQPFRPEQWRGQGVDASSIRLGPALLGLITVPILGLATAQVFGWRIALLAAGLLAVAPWHIYWSQGGRFYGMQFLFYGLTFLWYFKGVQERSSRWVALSMGAMLLAAMTQPTALVFGFIAVGDWLITLARRKPTGLRLPGYASLGAGFGLGAAMLWSDMTATGPVQVPVTEPTFFKLAAGSVYLVGPAVTAFAGFAAWMLLRHNGARTAWYLLLGGVVPIVVFTILSYRAYAGTRYAFVCLYAWLLLTAIGVDYCYRAIRTHWGPIAAVAPLAVLVVPMLVANVAYFTFGRGLHPRYRDAYEFVRSQRTEGEAVAVNKVSWVGRFYLEDADVQAVAGPNELAEAQQPTWLVLVHEGPGREWEYWHRAGAAFRRRYEVWTQMPVASVSVFRYEGNKPGQHESAD